MSLYARNNKSVQKDWKEKIHKKFRETTQRLLENNFSFYAMKAREGVNTEKYIQTHFKEVIGKIYSPFEDSKILSLALDKNEKQKAANDELLKELRKSFYVQPCSLGENPELIITQAIS